MFPFDDDGIGSLEIGNNGMDKKEGVEEKEISKNKFEILFWWFINNKFLESVYDAY